MTGAQYGAELFTWDLARRGNTIARIGRLRRENARSGLRAWNKFERPAFARVAMTTGPSKSAKHPSPAEVEVGWVADASGKGRPGVTMGALSLEICREHAGWSVHCFNASFRWKTYRLASPSRKNSADAKLTRRRTTGVDSEYKSRHCRDNHSPPKALLSYLGFCGKRYVWTELYTIIMCENITDKSVRESTENLPVPFLANDSDDVRRQVN